MARSTMRAKYSSHEEIVALLDDADDADEALATIAALEAVLEEGDDIEDIVHAFRAAVRLARSAGPFSPPETEIVVTYEDEHGDHEVSAASLLGLAKALAEAGYEGPRLKAYEGEILRGWVGADGYTSV